MTTARFYFYNDAQLLMLRHKRRVFLRRVMVWAGATCFVASVAFLAGLYGFGAG